MSAKINSCISVPNTATGRGMLVLEIEGAQNDYLMCIELAPTRAEFKMLAQALRIATANLQSTSRDCGACWVYGFGDGNAELKISSKNPNKHKRSHARANLRHEHAVNLATRIDRDLAANSQDADEAGERA